MALYLLIAGPATSLELGEPVPVGAAIDRIEWDGVSPYTPPFGCTAIADDGRDLWTAPDEG